jgi:hypothetical protein
MRWSFGLAVMLAMGTSLLAGCAAAGCGNSSSGQTCEGPGALAYNGASGGTQTSKTIACDTGGSFSWTSNIGSGSVTFTVLDGLGVAKFTETISGPGQDADEVSVAGAAGDWVVKATRSGSLMTGGFSGQYTANLAC